MINSKTSSLNNLYLSKENTFSMSFFFTKFSRSVVPLDLIKFCYLLEIFSRFDQQNSHQNGNSMISSFEIFTVRRHDIGAGWRWVLRYPSSYPILIYLLVTLHILNGDKNWASSLSPHWINFFNKKYKFFCNP